MNVQKNNKFMNLNKDTFMKSTYSKVIPHTMQNNYFTILFYTSARKTTKEKCKNISLSIKTARKFPAKPIQGQKKITQSPLWIPSKLIYEAI